MRKCLILLLGTLLFLSFVVNANTTAVQKVIGDPSDIVVLATIIEINDDSIELSKEYEISPKDTVLPSTIIVNKFKYSYCNEHSNSYNAPQIGDNIVINLSYKSGKYLTGEGIYKVDTVSNRTLKVFVPIKMKDEQCSDEMLALAHYIRTDGEQTEYKYTNGEVLSVNDGEILNDYEADYIAYYSNNLGVNSNGFASYIQKTNFSDSQYFEGVIISVLVFLLGLGIGIIYFINKRNLSKQ